MPNLINEPNQINQPNAPLYKQIYDALAQDIRQGRAKPGQKLASEAALVKRFHTSRITVTRALRELQQSGLVERVAGSGTYVRNAATERLAGLTFGLIIPDLGETEIFEPICQGIATAEPEGEHALLWGHAHAAKGTKREQALQLCDQYIARHVAGVFFAPIEGDGADDEANAAVLRLLKQANVPVVLLDRRTASPLESIRPDLAGIDNARAGLVATSHLLSLGVQNVAFVARRQSAPTIVQRAAGFLEALALFNRNEAPPNVIQFETIDEAFEALVSGDARACVCANDRIAGELMHVLLRAGLKIPDDFRIVGMDDVNYASLLPVPLTTVRQPCREIGRAALGLMLERIEHPDMPAREVLLDCELVVRRSCGGKSG
jgi:GntR family transcriptional regulator, arabinose operon transcriptional repressor